MTASVLFWPLLNSGTVCLGHLQFLLRDTDSMAYGVEPLNG